MTLNAGFAQLKDPTFSDTDAELVADFLKRKSVTICPPVSASGNEASPSTHERIMAARKAFRQKNRDAARLARQTAGK